MSLVDVTHTKTKNPDSRVSSRKAGCVCRTGKLFNQAFFRLHSRSTVIDTIANGPESASCDVKTGNPLHQGLKPRSVYVCDFTTSQQVTR